MKNTLTDEQLKVALDAARVGTFCITHSVTRQEMWLTEGSMPVRKFADAVIAAHEAIQPDRDAEIARILAASRYSADLCTQALDDIKLKDAEIAALRFQSTPVIADRRPRHGPGGAANNQGEAMKNTLTDEQILRCEFDAASANHQDGKPNQG